MSRTPTLNLVPTLAWTIGFFALFTVPRAVDDLAGSVADRQGFWWAWLMVLYPVLVPALSAVAAALHRTWLLPIGVALAWVPAALMLLNSSALVYAGAFLALSAVGVGAVGLPVAVARAVRRPRRVDAAAA